MAVIYCSIVDLLACDDTRETIRNNDKDKLFNILWGCGFDVKGWGVNEMLCYHRPLSYILRGDHRPIYTLKYTSVERLDSEWIESGNASKEVLREHMAKKDKQLVRDLECMERYPNFTGMAMAHLEEHWSLFKGKQDD